MATNTRGQRYAQKGTARYNDVRKGFVFLYGYGKKLTPNLSDRSFQSREKLRRFSGKR